MSKHIVTTARGNKLDMNMLKSKFESTRRLVARQINKSIKKVVEPKNIKVSTEHVKSINATVPSRRPTIFPVKADQVLKKDMPTHPSKNTKKVK